MKKTIFITFIFVITFSFISNAQNCFEYLPSVGSSLETSHYNQKKELTSISTMTILNQEKVEDGEKLDIKLESKGVSTDSVFTNEYSYLCKDGKLYVDMTSYMNKSLSAYQGMQVEVDAGNLEIPNHPKAGQSLPGGTASAKVTNNGMPIVNIMVTISDRRVDAIETLTTPAGDFECFKIYQKTESKIAFLKVKGASAEWYSEGYGIIRTESYNKKGKLISYSELSKVIKK